MDPVSAFRAQADKCAALGSPMYAELLAALADDLAAGGVTSAVLAGHEDDPGPSALALRLAGSLHRLVLERRAGALAAYYPSVGGVWSSDGPAEVLRVLGEQPEAVQEWLDRPPQTNEVGRAAALYGALLHLPDRPLRLFEIGASAGLNLRADRFSYGTDDGRVFGDAASPVRLAGAFAGRLPEDRGLEVVSRVGCDLWPVDVGSTDGRLALTAYVWADQVERLERLRAALRVAAAVPAEVRTQSALDLVSALAPEPGTLTVLWHSVMWQYLDAEEKAGMRAALEAVGARATQEAPFAHVFLEPERREPQLDHEYLVQVETWPGGVRRVLGAAAPHGVPVVWD